MHTVPFREDYHQGIGLDTYSDMTEIGNEKKITTINRKTCFIQLSNDFKKVLRFIIR